MVIPVDKKTLMPVIGVNESGKTTILHAIFAFDHHNDSFNEGRQIKDTVNLYRTSPDPAVVEACIEMTRTEFLGAVSKSERKHPDLKQELSALKKRRNFPGEVTISREIASKRYTWNLDRLGSAQVQHVVAVQALRCLPYVLFFDDFRDKIDEKIEITKEKTGWLAIIEQLFEQTDESFSVDDLAGMEERQRKTVLAKVQRRLNDTLTQEWQSFRLDDRDALKISISFLPESHEQRTVLSVNASGAIPVPPQPTPIVVTRNFIKLEVVETDGNGDQHFFFISDRSKGFYWFFNFVMKLEFNPKVVNSDGRTIYLLDEPGSYLHAFAQRKLCQKLRQLSERNCVIYCTHSHYLLDPEQIPLNNIAVADKDRNGNVTLIPLAGYRSANRQTRSALEPLLDALQLRPFALDLITTRLTVVAEGVYDYYALELLRAGRPISILPSVGADSIKYYVSLLIAWQIDFRAIWDNDEEGRKKHADAARLFGPEIATEKFRLLPLRGTGRHRIIQNLFDGNDLSAIRAALGLARDCSFERTICALFYSQDRDRLVRSLSSNTRDNFDGLFDSLGLG